VESLGLEMDVGTDGESVTLSCKKPIKAIVLDVEGGDMEFSDQAIDLIPGDPQTIQAINLNGRRVNLRYLRNETCESKERGNTQ